MTHYLSFPLKIFIDMNCLIDITLRLSPLTSPFLLSPSPLCLFRSHLCPYPLSALPSAFSMFFLPFSLSTLSSQFFPRLRANVRCCDIRTNTLP